MTKKGCNSLTTTLRQSGLNAMGIHGDKSQQERDAVLHDFRTGSCCIMIATDVAARGLDVKEVKVVINYDFPSCCEDYVHRIGRTGRAGATGTAYSFFTADNARQGKELIKILEQNGQIVPEALRSLAYSVRGGGNNRSRWGGGRGGGGAGGRGGMGGGNRYGQSNSYSQQQNSWGGQSSYNPAPRTNTYGAPAPTPRTSTYGAPAPAPSYGQAWGNTWEGGSQQYNPTAY